MRLTARGEMLVLLLVGTVLAVILGAAYTIGQDWKEVRIHEASVDSGH